MATQLDVSSPLASSDLQLRKLTRWFASFDVDRDGVIDVLDFTGMAQVYCEAYEVAPRSDKWRRMHHHALIVWRAIEQRIGAAHPARLTREEWLAWPGTSEYVDFIICAAIPFSQMAFSIADADGDGRCNVYELMAAQRRSGMSEEEIHRAFDRLDRDRDGYVTADDFERAHREFYFSDDPEAPGNYLAGEI
jgi:Ca2+-binding EF-hand superfamily protein